MAPILQDLNIRIIFVSYFATLSDFIGKWRSSHKINYLTEDKYAICQYS